MSPLRLLWKLEGSLLVLTLDSTSKPGFAWTVWNVCHLIHFIQGLCEAQEWCGNNWVLGKNMSVRPCYKLDPVICCIKLFPDNYICFVVKLKLFVVSHSWCQFFSSFPPHIIHPPIINYLYLWRLFLGCVPAIFSDILSVIFVKFSQMSPSFSVISSRLTILVIFHLPWVILWMFALSPFYPILHLSSLSRRYLGSSQPKSWYITRCSIGFGEWMRNIVVPGDRNADFKSSHQSAWLEFMVKCKP